MSLPPDRVSEDMGCPSTAFVCLTGQILLLRYVMNGLRSHNETYREYLLAPTDDPIRFWRLSS